MPLALHSRHSDESVGARLPPTRETDLDRILKLIPTEMLAFYTAAGPVTADLQSPSLRFAIFLGCGVLVPVVLYLDGRNTGAPAAWPQYAIRVLTFVAWAIAIAWPFAAWSSDDSFSWLRSSGVLVIPLVASLLLPQATDR
jgi:hypothetical protein